MSPRTRAALTTILLCSIIGGTQAAQAGPTVISSTWQPYSFLQFVPCARDGLGEAIDVTGVTHFVALSTTDGAMIAINFSGTAVGQQSGTIYTAGFAAKLQGQAGSTNVVSGHDSVRYLGRGTGTKLIVHTLFHVTRLADGTYKVELSTLRQTCR
jgi:hypothetical protein